MKYIKARMTLIAGLLLLNTLLACTSPNKHFWEVPSHNLPYIALIRELHPLGTAVSYNYQICEQIGDACGFFRSHAYAHAQLDHPIVPPESYPDSLEFQADCWAAKHADAKEVLAAVQLLADKNRSPDIPITGDPAQRAQRIRACAIESGNWIGNE